MTRFQALYVKYLRIICGGSWRWVAGKYSERYYQKLPFTIELTYGGNQIDGMQLCSDAMDLLKEKIEDGWN